MEIHSSRPFLGDEPLAVFQLLADLPIRHCVDVGAAAGSVARTIKRFAGPAATLDAFEPFPGNIPFAEKTLAGLKGVTLHQAAIGTQVGTGRLRVPSVVTGTEAGWETRIGYSSLGRLVSDELGDTLDVPVVSIDEAVPGPISFMKIDVQGTELDVLESARGHFEAGTIDMCFVEYAAEDGLIEFFASHGWHLFYAPVLVIDPEPSAAEKLPDAAIVKTLTLSTGNTGEYVWPATLPVGADAFRETLITIRKQFLGAQTDLIAVAPHAMPGVLRAAASRLEASQPVAQR